MERGPAGQLELLPAPAPLEPVRTRQEWRRLGRGERLARILRAGITVFHRLGYQAATMDDVAAQLGITKAALYTYVKSKEELLFLIYLSAGEQFERLVEQVLADEKLSPVEKLHRLVVSHAELIAGDPELFNVFFARVPFLPEAHRQRIRAGERRYVEGLEAILRAGIESGRFRPVPVRMASFGLLGMLNWMARWFRPGAGLSGREVGEIFFGLISEGVLLRR